MELQLLLVLFTLFVSWSAGLFAALYLYTFMGKDAKTRGGAWLLAVLLLVIGCVVALVPSTQGASIFDGFCAAGYGVAEEPFAIAILMLVAVLYLASYLLLGAIPKLLNVAGMVMSFVVIACLGHTFSMVAMPLWNCVFQMISLLGGACLLGPATYAMLTTFVADKSDISLSVFGGSMLNVAAAWVSILAMIIAGGALTGTSPFAGQALPFTLATLACVVISAVATLMGKKQGWKVVAPTAVVCGVAASVCVHAALFVAGGQMVLF